MSGKFTDVFYSMWDHLEERLLVGGLAFSVALVFLQVVMRYVFRSSLSWSEELARYLFLWQIWLGASYAVRRRRHLRIDVVRNMFTGSGRRIFELCALAVWLAFSIFLVYKGGQLTKMLVIRHQLSPAMQIPIAWAYASVPVGCTLMSLRLVQQMYRIATGREEVA